MKVVFPHGTSTEVSLDGHAFLNGALVPPDQALAVYAAGDYEDFRSKIAASYGNFRIVVQKNGELWAAVDRLRSLPLFHGQHEGKLMLGDDPYWIRDAIGDAEPDAQSAAELWFLLYVLDNRTLAKNVKQVRPGDTLRATLDANNVLRVETSRYYRFLNCHPGETDWKETLARFDDIHVRAFERLLASAQGRQLVVPLSGGLDSRLIVCMLKRLGVKDVMCFSYGMQGNPEAKISQYVAKQLGYPWTFVSYDKFDWNSEECSAAREQFFRQSAKLSALPPILEDWIAVWMLKHEDRIDRNAIFCPGHTASFSTGGVLLKQISSSKGHEELIGHLLYKHSPRMHWHRMQPEIYRTVHDTISASLADIERQCPADMDPVRLSTCWDWSERQCKRNVNMVRTYEYWGYDWQIPLWDGELMDFWCSTSLDLFIKKKYYRYYVKSVSDRNLFGLFDPENPALNNVAPRLSALALMQRVLRRFALTRYFCADKNIEKIVCGDYFNYMRRVGARALSYEPVTTPWLLLERYGIESLWEPARLA